MGEDEDEKPKLEAPEVHKVVSIKVLFHTSDDSVCPRSRGCDKCPLDDPDTGLPRFEDPDDVDVLLDLRDVRDLAGTRELVQKLRRISTRVNGLKPLDPTSMSDDELLTRVLSLKSDGGGARTDSGVAGLGGELIVNQQQFFQPDIFDEEDEDLFEDEDLGEDEIANHYDREAAKEDGSLGPLPTKREIKKFKKKQRVGLNFLASITPEQLAALSPEIKSSMDNFIQTLTGVSCCHSSQAPFLFSPLIPCRLLLAPPPLPIPPLGRRFLPWLAAAAASRRQKMTEWLHSFFLSPVRSK